MPKYTRSEVWERGFRKGQKAERERIIALLEAHRDKGYLGMTQDGLIALIKGENE